MLRKISAMLTKPSIREVIMKDKEVAKSRTINNLGNYKGVTEKEAFVIILRNVYIWPVQLKLLVACLCFLSLQHQCRLAQMSLDLAFWPYP